MGCEWKWKFFVLSSFKLRHKSRWSKQTRKTARDDTFRRGFVHFFVLSSGHPSKKVDDQTRVQMTKIIISFSKTNKKSYVWRKICRPDGKRRSKRIGSKKLGLIMWLHFLWKGVSESRAFAFWNQWSDDVRRGNCNLIVQTFNYIACTFIQERQILFGINDES